MLTNVSGKTGEGHCDLYVSVGSMLEAVVRLKADLQKPRRIRHRGHRGTENTERIRPEYFSL